MTSRHLILSFTLCLLSILFDWGYTLTQTAPPMTLTDPNAIAMGDELFAKNCSVGYCHGKGGRAGRGPRLRGKEFEKEYLFNVTSKGIPGSSMPAWKDRLSEQEIWSVVAYILTLSKLKSDSDESPASASVEKSQEVRPALSDKSSGSTPASSQAFTQPNRRENPQLIGDPEKGKALFFDSSNDLNCATCHKFRGSGADIGPDLNKARIGQKSAKEILKEILLPGAVLSPGYTLLRIATKSGEQISGLKVEENDLQLKVYDVGSFPPVLRTIGKSDIQGSNIENRSAMPDKYGEIYSVKQLLDLIAFLKSGDSKVVANVGLMDLF